MTVRGIQLAPGAPPRTVPRGRWRVSSGRALAEWASGGAGAGPEEAMVHASASLGPGDEVEGQPPHVRASAMDGPCRLERAGAPEGAGRRAAWRAGIATAIAGVPQGREGTESATILDEALAKRAQTLAEVRRRTGRELAELRETKRSMDRDRAHLRWIESRFGVQAGAVSLGHHHGVSGDFAVAEMDRMGRMWLVFGDSAGHGPGPSHFGLLTSTLIGRNLDAVACESALPGAGDSPPVWRHGAEALRRTAGALSRSGAGQYSTAAVVMLTPSRRGALTATWSLAGHPHPVVCLPDGTRARARALWGRARSRAPNGTALGLSSKGRGHYPVFRAAMPPGSALAMVSDGVGDWLGEERVLGIMSRNLDRRSEVMCRELLQATRRRDSEREGDDRTALAARNVRRAP